MRPIEPAPKLVTPTREFEPSYRTYVAELQARGEPLIPFPLALPYESFDELLAVLAANSRGPMLPGFVPNSTFWLVLGREILAVSNLRHALTPSLERRGGHIGYSVRPSRRRRGYGTLILALTLREAGKLGLETALLTCARDNAASVSVIVANGGVLHSEELVAEDGEVVQRYHVPVTEAQMATAKPKKAARCKRK